MSEEKKLFKSILVETKSIIGEENFAFAFSSIELISLKNGKLVFGVPATFIKEIIEKEKTSLQTIAKKIANIEEIEIVISNQENAANFYDEHPSSPAPLSPPQKQTMKPSPDKRKEYGLNPNFSFDNFVVGDGNFFAHSIAKVVSSNLGVAHNPCLFYGSVGLGKTHLLQAIGNYIFDNFPKKKVIFYTLEEFLFLYVTALQNNDMKKFKNNTRKIDVLLIDDIQFLTGKERLQEELYHIFNTLIGEEKQMLFSSDRPLHKIPDLADRLQSRFRGSMMADIQAPSKEMAMSIINNAIEKNMNKKHRSERSFDIRQEVLDFIVDRLRYNIRDMLGIIDTIVGYQDALNQKVGLEKIREFATMYKPQKNLQKKHTIDNIVQATSKFFDMPVSDITSKKRNRQIVRVRHIAMYLLKELTKNSLTEIGKIFSVSHVSVSVAINNIEEEKTIDSEIIEILENIKEIIYQRKR